LNRTKSEVDADEEIKKFIKELENMNQIMNRMKSRKDVDENIQEHMNELVKTLEKS